jgi:zinc transport system substrate-binding protein
MAVEMRLLVQFFVLLLAAVIPAAAQDAGSRVVVTSKPVHALVAEVMQGVGTPSLLVDGMASPHTFSMRPSDAKKVNNANVFIRVSEGLEPFTGRLVRSLPKSVTVVTLAEAEGMRLLERREGGPFEAHSHAHGPKKGSGHKGHAHSKPANGPVSDYDAHIWLDPDNAKAIVAVVAAALARHDPTNAALFEANATRVAGRIDTLANALAADLAGVSGKPFLVLHDAYQYFERRFGLTAIGSIVVSPEEQPSAKRISDLRRKVGALSAVCVFAEPNHQPKVVTSVVEGTKARTAVLDPEGAMLTAGPDLYFELMRRLASSMRECLAAA